MSERDKLGVGIQTALSKDYLSLRERGRMSDEELGNLLAAVVNHEAKAITLISMTDEEIYSRGELYRKVINLQGDSPSWKMDDGVPFSYCLHSLAPIGLIAKEYIDLEQGVWGYAVTPYGEKVGKALAGYLLSFSLRYPGISLQDIFGSTVGSGGVMKTIETVAGEVSDFKKRSPLTRLRIFRRLATGPLPIQKLDLAQEFGEKLSELSTEHLISLAESDLIAYEAIQVNRPRSFYQLSTRRPVKEPESYPYYISLTKPVLEIFSKHPDKNFTSEDTAKYLVEKDTKYGEMSRKSLFHNISTILAHLVRGGYLVRGKFGKEKKSEITLTDSQRQFLQELVGVIDDFQGQTPGVLEKGVRLANEIIADPQKVSFLFKKAREASPQANRLALEESCSLIRFLVRDNPDITNKELYDLLHKGNIKLGMERLRQLTHLLEKEGQLSARREGLVKRYRVTQ